MPARTLVGGRPRLLVGGRPRLRRTKAGTRNGGAHVAPRVVQPKWIFDQICPPARVAEESAQGSAAEAPAAELQLGREGSGAALQPEGTSGLDPGAESDGSDGFSEEY